MSTNTEFYNLVKPALSDAPDITALNGNWDTIDTFLDKNNAGIVIGYYEGDGRYGTDERQCSITFPDYFYPYMLVVGPTSDNTTMMEVFFLPANSAYTFVYIKGDGTFTISRTTDTDNVVKTVILRWYNTTAEKQMNESLETYRWFAIGRYAK